MAPSTFMKVSNADEIDLFFNDGDSSMSEFKGNTNVDFDGVAQTKASPSMPEDSDVESDRLSRGECYSLGWNSPVPFSCFAVVPHSGDMAFYRALSDEELVQMILDKRRSAYLKDSVIMAAM